MDCNLPSSSLHGILQARVLEWVQINEEEIGKLPGKKKIRIMIVKMTKNLENKMEKIQESI